MRPVLLLMLCFSMTVAPMTGQRGFAPAGSRVRDIQDALGRGQMTLAALLLKELPPSTDQKDEDERALLRAATLLGTARADALLNLAKTRTASAVGYRALAALYQHLTLDRTIGGSQGRMQPVFPNFGYLRDDIDFDSQVGESEITQFAKEAIPLARRAESHRPNAATIDDATETIAPPLAVQFERLLISQLPMASIRPTPRLPVPRPLARSVFARFKTSEDAPALNETELRPDSEWLAIPESPTGRLVLELEADGVTTRRWIDQNPFDAVAQVFDTMVVFAVARDGQPFEGATIKFDNRTLVTDATGIAVSGPRLARDYMTSAIVMAADRVMTIPISVRSTTSSADTALVGHVLVDRVHVRPGERLQGRLFLLRDEPTRSTPTPLASASIEWALVYGDDRQRLPLPRTTSSPHGFVPFDIVVPADATAAPLSLEVRAGRRLIESFRVAHVQVLPEVVLRRRDAASASVVGISNSDGTLTLDVNADGMSDKVLIPVKRSEMFALDITRIPQGCGEIVVTATLNSGPPPHAQDKIVLTGPFVTPPTAPAAELATGATIERSPVRAVSLDEALKAAPGPRERYVEGVVRFYPRAPVLVSVARDHHVLSKVVKTDEHGRATFAFDVTADFGSSVECVASGGAPANAPSQVMPLSVTTHRMVMTKKPGREGHLVLTPALFTVGGIEVAGTFSAVVHEGLDGGGIDSLSNALPPRQGVVRTFGTDRIVPDITVLGDMLRDGDLWRSTLNNRIYGYDFTTQMPVRSPYKSLPIRGHATPSILRTSAYRTPLAIVSAWSASSTASFLELPEQGPWTASISGVDEHGSYAELTIVHGKETPRPLAILDMETIRAGAVERALAQLSSADESAFSKALPQFPPYIVDSEIERIRETLLAKLALVAPADAWIPPEGASLKGLTPVFLDDRVLAELNRVGVLRRLTGFPDPSHDATKAWATSANMSNSAISRDLSIRTLIARLARGDESVLPGLSLAIEDRQHEFPTSALADLNRCLVPNLWRGAMADATRWEGIRTQRSATDLRCEPWYWLFSAIYGRVRDHHVGWRAVGCAILDIDGAMPGAARGPLTAKFTELSASMAAAILDDVKTLSPEVPAEADQIKRLPFRTLVESLSPKDRAPYVVAIISAWIRATPRPQKWVEATIGDLLEPLPRYGRLHDVTSRRLSADAAWTDALIGSYVALLSAGTSDEVAVELAHHAPPRVWKDCPSSVLARTVYATTFSACVELWRREDGVDVIRRIAREDLWPQLLMPARFHALGCKDPSQVFEGLDLEFIIACARSDLGQPDHQGFTMVVRALVEAGRDDPAPLITALLDPKFKAGRVAFAAALGTLKYSEVAWPIDTPDWDEARHVLQLRADPTSLPAFRTWYASKSRPTSSLLAELGPHLTVDDWLTTIERLRALDKRSPPVGFQGTSLLLGCSLDEISQAWDRIPESWCQLTADLVDQPVRVGLVEKTKDAKGQRRILDEMNYGLPRWTSTRQAAAVARCLDLLDRGHPLPNSEWATKGIELWLLRTGLGLP